MIIANSAAVEAVPTEDEIVGQGPVYRKALIDAKDTGGFSVLLVTFEPGARLNFHTHTFEQILYVTEGKGVVATREKERVVTPGEVIYIAPGEVLEIVADDKGIKQDMPAWAQTIGNEFLGVEESGGEIKVYVKKK